jgi:hypothetical protein
MVEDFLLKMAVIAGASKALKIKVQNPRWSDEKVIQKINRETKSIIESIDGE